MSRNGPLCDFGFISKIRSIDVDRDGFEGICGCLRLTFLVSLMSDHKLMSFLLSSVDNLLRLTHGMVRFHNHGDKKCLVAHQDDHQKWVWSAALMSEMQRERKRIGRLTSLPLL